MQGRDSFGSRGMSRAVRKGEVWSGKLRIGSPGKVWLVVAVPGMVWPGKAVVAGYISVWHCMER